MKINVLPLLPKEILLNSLCNFKIILFQKNLTGQFNNQNIWGIKKKPKIIPNQLIDKLYKEVEGSKTENKLFII